MAEADDKLKILNTLACVSEDLALELLSNLTQDELRELTNVVAHLSQAAELLQQNEMDPPFPLLELLRNAGGQRPQFQ